MNVGPQAEVAPREKRYDRLRKMGATNFQASTDPIEAERWLREIERIFLHMQYTSEEKLDYAVSLL